MTKDGYQFSQFVGVDVSKDKLDFAFAGKKQRCKINNSKGQIVSQLIGRLEHPATTIVVMEATGGYEKRLVALLHQHNIALAVVNPRRVRDFAKGIDIDAKTDSIDAGVIAFYAEVIKPDPQLAQSENEEKLRALVERRRQLLGLINQENNRLQQTIDREIRDYIRQSLETLKKQVKTIDERLAESVHDDEANARKVEILQSVDGLGPVTVSTLVATRFNTKIKTFYQRLLARGKPKKVALTAAMRKLLTILNTLIKRDVLWTDEPKKAGV